MTKLTSRLDRLEQDGGRYCTLGEILDAIETRGRGGIPAPLRPIDPRLCAFLAQMDLSLPTPR